MARVLLHTRIKESTHEALKKVASDQDRTLSSVAAKILEESVTKKTK